MTVLAVELYIEPTDRLGREMTAERMDKLVAGTASTWRHAGTRDGDEYSQGFYVWVTTTGPVE